MLGVKSHISMEAVDVVDRINKQPEPTSYFLILFLLFSYRSKIMVLFSNLIGLPPVCVQLNVALFCGKNGEELSTMTPLPFLFWSHFVVFSCARTVSRQKGFFVF
jgi:hypothetical protein